MKKMLLEKRDDVLSVLKTIGFFLLVYAIMLQKHFSPDSFTYMQDPVGNNMGNPNLGRLGDYVVNKVICALNINYVEQQFIFVLILIITLAFSTELLYMHYMNIARKQFKKNQCILLKMSIMLMFCNVFIQEWFVFVEMTFLWSFSLVFMVLAVLQIKSEFRLSNLVLCILFSIVSISFYQATIGFLVCFGLFSVYVSNCGILNKKSFVDSVKVLLCGGIAGGLNILSIKLMQIIGVAVVTERTSAFDISTIINNVISVLYEIKTWLFIGNGLLPKYCLIFFVVILYTVCIICCLRMEQRLSKTVYIILMLMACNAIVYFPHLMTATVWMAPRTLVAFLVIIALPCMMLSVLDIHPRTMNICSVCMFLLLVLNIWGIQKISLNTIASNRIDEELSYQINYQIEKYEKETGNTINKIGTILDAMPQWGYRTIDCVSYDINTTVYCNPARATACINYYNEKKYQPIFVDEETRDVLLKNRNWDSISIDEQLIFSEDTVFIIAY